MRHTTAFPAVSILVAACGGGQDTAVPLATPPLPVALCGSERYAPLPAQGQVVDWDELDAWNLSAASLDLLISLAGFESLTPVPNGAKLYQYRYTTQDRGQQVEATGMVGLPADLQQTPMEPWPVALMLHGFAGASDPCAPSADELIGPAQPALLASYGFVVIAPDYIGMNGMGDPSTASHAPLVGEQVALGSWDALRAGLSLVQGELAEDLEGSLGEEIIIWGASQGGHAAFFTELAGPYYAPEFEIAGVAASAPAHSLLSVISHAIEEYADPTALAALTLVGMRRWYGDPDDLHGLLTNEKPWYFADNVEEALEGDGKSCEQDIDFDPDSIDSVDDIYAAEFIEAALAGDWDAVEPWGCFIRQNSVSQSSIPRLRDTPLLAVYGSEDSLVVPAFQADDFDLLCEQGWNMEHIECAAAAHAEGTLWSLQEQVDWLRARIAGEPLDAPCQRTAPRCCSATPEKVACKAS